MNDEWKGIKVRSVVHPRDGGVNNRATEGRYTMYHTDLRERFAAERERMAEVEVMEPIPGAVLSLLARVTT